MADTRCPNCGRRIADCMCGWAGPVLLLGAVIFFVGGMAAAAWGSQ